MGRHPKYNELIYDCYVSGEKGIEIAKRYGVSESYISQTKSKLRQLIYKPKIENEKIVCYKCGNVGELVFHHNHNTRQQVALVCTRCNLRIMNNELDYSNEVVNGGNLTKKIIKGYLQFNELFESLVKNLTTDNLKTLLQNIDIKLIKELNSELI